MAARVDLSRLAYSQRGYRLKILGVISILMGFFCLYALFLVFRPRRERDQSITQDELLALMQQRAQEAVERASSEYLILLDFSPASVERVDEILGRLHERHAASEFSNEELTHESMTWGAYVGEVIKKVRPGEWAQDSAVAGPFSLPIVYSDAENSQSFPVGWCRKRIVNGDEDNIWIKFNFFVMQRGDYDGITELDISKTSTTASTTE